MTRPAPGKRRLTIERQAEALGCSLATVKRQRARGLPAPRDGEPASAWRRRAKRWQTRNVARPGRRLSSTAQEAQLDYRRARAQRAELRLARAIEQVHSVAECREAMAARVATVAAAFAHLPDAIATKLTGTEDQYQILEMTERLIRAAHQALFDAWPVVDPSAEAPPFVPAPEPDAALPVKDRSEYWLGVWRSTRAETERRALARDRGDVHDEVPCEQAECVRIASFMHELCALPSQFGAKLLHLRPDGARDVARANLDRVVGILRGEAPATGDDENDLEAAGAGAAATTFAASTT